MDSQGDLRKRFKEVRKEASSTRSSLYHLTNKCNLRCKGCWFFEKEFDKSSDELNDLLTLEARIQDEVERGVNAPLLIGGEPALFLDRISLFRKYMPKVSISTNGLKKVPYEGFEDVTIAISVFGGGPLDDELRAIGPTGKKFTGLLDKAMENYKHDDRAGFVYAVTYDGMPYIEETVKKIEGNGNRLLFNYYSDYGSGDCFKPEYEQRLLDLLLELKEKYPETIASHPYYIEALILGRTSWGEFGYYGCPSVSEDYTGNAQRLEEGGPALPKFNAYAADMKTVMQCCTSGDCDKCRDSQAVSSWLLVNAKKIMQEPDGLRIWTEIAESYFSQFVWSSYHPRNKSYVQH